MGWEGRGVAGPPRMLASAVPERLLRAGSGLAVVVSSHDMLWMEDLYVGFSRMWCSCAVLAGGYLARLVGGKRLVVIACDQMCCSGWSWAIPSCVGGGPLAFCTQRLG